MGNPVNVYSANDVDNWDCVVSSIKDGGAQVVG